MGTRTHITVHVSINFRGWGIFVTKLYHENSDLISELVAKGQACPTALCTVGSRRILPCREWLLELIRALRRNKIQ